MAFWKKGLWLLPFIIGLVVSAVLASPLNHIRQIDIQGNNLVSAEQIASYTMIDDKMSMMHLNKAKPKVESNIINSHATIKNATVSINNWRDVLIEIQEYRPVGYVQEADFYYLLLENGLIVDEAFAQTKLPLPMITNFDENQRASLVAELTKMPDSILSQISEVVNLDASSSSIGFRMTDGNIVKGLLPTIANRIQYYPSIVESLDGQTGLIDMEVGIYYQELTPANNPFATDEEKQAYEEESAEVESSTIEVTESASE